MAKIIHARINEKGEISGGKPGDQTGKEVVKQDFYDDDWHTVFRPKEPAVAKHLVAGAEQIAKNENIGYGQDDRYTMFEQAKKVNFDFSKIKTPCACDCSQMIATLIMSAGIDIKKEFFTWNMTPIMDGTGQFEKIKYKQGMQLNPGDIVLKTGHVVLVVEGSVSYPIWTGECYGAEFVPVYKEPTKTSARCSWPTLATGNLFDVWGEKGEWFYICIASEHWGYIQKAFVLRKTPYKTGKVTSAVYIRQNAGTKYKKIGVLETGDKVQICDVKKAENGADWYYIKLKEGWGFSSARYIKED